MQFRIEKRDSFNLNGIPAKIQVAEDASTPTMRGYQGSIHLETEGAFLESYEEFKALYPGGYAIVFNGDPLEVGAGDQKQEIKQLVIPITYDRETPRITAYDYASQGGETTIFMGSELDRDSTLPQAHKFTTQNKEIPAATWAVFAVDIAAQVLPEVYTRIITEWFPSSGYNRDRSIPHMEIVSGKPDAKTGISSDLALWFPVVPK